MEESRGPRKVPDTYSFLVRCNNPERVGLVRARTWQTFIQEKLRQISSLSREDLIYYFDSINYKLLVYENVKDALALLELAIWKSKITEQLYDRKNDNHTVDMLKMLCRTDSLTMVNIIVPNVFSFLNDGNNDNVVVGWDEDYSWMEWDGDDESSDSDEDGKDDSGDSDEDSKDDSNDSDDQDDKDNGDSESEGNRNEF